MVFSFLGFFSSFFLEEELFKPAPDYMKQHFPKCILKIYSHIKKQVNL